MREFPQNWPSFLDDLLPTQSACGVIADLCDAIRVHPGVSSARCEELLRALSTATSLLLPVVVARLPDKEAFRAAEGLLQWVSVEECFDRGLVEAVLAFVKTDHWSSALSCVSAFVERRCEEFESFYKKLVQILVQIPVELQPARAYLVKCAAPPGNGVPQLREAWLANGGTGNTNGIESRGLHDFVERLIGVLSLLGVNHFVRCFMYSRRGVAKVDPGDDVIAAAFVDVLLVGISHQSTALRLAALPFFVSVLGNVVKSDHRSALATYIAQGYFHAASASLLPHEQITSGYEDDEHIAAAQNFSARCMALFTSVGKVTPDSSVYAFRRMRELLQGRGGRMVQALEGHAWLFGDTNAHTEACLEAACTSADAVATGVPQDYVQNLLPEMRTCYDVLQNLSATHLQSFRAHALRAFVVLYRVEAAALDRCVELLGGLVNQRKGRARARVCQSLSVIFRRCDGANVGRYAGALCEYCLKALGEDFYTSEKINLVEASLTAVLALQTFGERLMYVERVLIPVLDVLVKPDVKKVLSSPLALYQFLEGASVDQAASVIGAFMVLETSTHHLVRPISKLSGPIPLPGVLSRSIAPRSVEVACTLIKCLHAMYNRKKFPVGIHEDALHPTSREVAYLLNLEMQKGIEQVAQREKNASLTEQRASATLESHGVDPPDETHGWLRESLRDLRRSAYEILRAAILSGVTQSPPHLQSLVEAVCSDFESIEPLHLLLIITRVLQPLLSHSVVAAGPAYLETLAVSPIAALVRHVRLHVDASQKGKSVFSSTATLDIARDHARRAIARSAADMLAVIYPRREQSKAEDNRDVPEHFPLVFKAGQLGTELALLWQTICNPGESRLDQGAARVGFALVVTAAEVAPQSEFVFFAPLLHGSLRTAVLNASKHAEDSPAQPAISAVLVMLRKWPVESEQAMQMLGGPAIKNWVSEAVTELAKAKPKKQRTIIKALIERLAEVEGTKENKGEVQALPEKLVTINPARAMKKPKSELDEIVLGDTALDSLFGEGDPL